MPKKSQKAIDYKIATIQILDHLWPFMQKTPKGGFSAHSGAKKAQKWGFSKKLSKNRQIKSSQVICDPKSQLFMSQFLNFQSETKIVKMTHSANVCQTHTKIISYYIRQEVYVHTVCNIMPLISSFPWHATYYLDWVCMCFIQKRTVL